MTHLEFGVTIKTQAFSSSLLHFHRVNFFTGGGFFVALPFENYIDDPLLEFVEVLRFIADSVGQGESK